MKVASDTLTFYPAEHDPEEGSAFDSYLIFNQCDGYHLVFARFDDGEFVHFHDWMDFGNGYKRDFYCAWARLPDEMQLFDIFGVKSPLSNYQPNPAALHTMKVLDIAAKP